MRRMFFTQWPSTANAWYQLNVTIISMTRKLLTIISLFWTLAPWIETHWLAHTGFHWSPGSEDLYEKQGTYLSVKLDIWTFSLSSTSRLSSVLGRLIARLMLSHKCSMIQAKIWLLKPFSPQTGWKVWVGEVEEGLFEKIHTVNKVDDLCNKYCSALTQNLSKLHDTHLHECCIVDGALFKNNLLWVSETLHTELLQEIHDQPSAGHPGVNWTVDLIQPPLLLVWTCGHS